ncbi:ComEC/Rec2 family competence protein [Gordonia mangrovi]|uniref:ComEC/Rec2 family competence protein n=1 Tax=Gordonia mangrovi TaxID=2665643 RepID=UPI0021ACB28E|nr:ComEC/Rec2 family competence protein [Gordonia mangrovi]UVF78488.1 ComEC/Rec2 family competence protein [Gordonia mangrovi]
MARDVVPGGDYRLVVPGLTTWAVTLLILYGPRWSVWPVIGGGALICAIAVLAILRVRVTWTAVSLVVIASGMATVTAGAMALRLETAAVHPLAEADGKARIAGVIRDDAMTLGSASSRVRIRIDVTEMAGLTVAPATAELTGPSETWAELSVGQPFSALVRVRPPRRGELLVARLSAVSAPHLSGRPPPHQRLATFIRQRLQQISARALGVDAAGLLPGLVLGDTSGLDADVRTDFRTAGLTHLVAVSGANFAIVCGAVVLAVRMLGASPRVTVVVGAIVVVSFVILVRPSPSVLRAAMMGLIGLLALVRSRRAQALPALGSAVVIGLLWWPELAADPGFALSVIATAGLVLWSAPVRDRLRGWGVPPGLAELTAMALVAQLITAPVVAMISGRFSVVGLAANIAVAPVVGLIAIGGTAAAVVGALGGADGLGAVCAELMIRALAPELWWMLTCARVLGRQSWAAITVPSGAVGALAVTMVTACALGAVGVVWQHWRRE